MRIDKPGRNQGIAMVDHPGGRMVAAQGRAITHGHDPAILDQHAAMRVMPRHVRTIGKGIAVKPQGLAQQERGFRHWVPFDVASRHYCAARGA